MATISDLLRTEESQLGYSRYTDPEQGTRYGRWYASLTKSPYFGTTGVPYCAMYQSWCLAQAKLKAYGFPTAACSPTVRSARAAGKLVPYDQCRAGDIVFFDWSGGGYRSDNSDHVGFVAAKRGDYIDTIEGNVSGLVKRCTRHKGHVVGCIRPDYEAEASKEEEEVYPFATIKRGSRGDTVKLAQSALNVRNSAGLVVDGYFGAVTDKAVRAWQAKKGLIVDGIVGPATWASLMLG